MGERPLPLCGIIQRVYIHEIVLLVYYIGQVTNLKRKIIQYVSSWMPRPPFHMSRHLKKFPCYPLNPTLQKPSSQLSQFLSFNQFSRNYALVFVIHSPISLTVNRPSSALHHDLRGLERPRNSFEARHQPL